MVRSKVTGVVGFAAAGVLLTILGGEARAAQTPFIDITFSGDTVGEMPLTGGATSLPLTKPSAIGGYAEGRGDPGDMPPTPASGTILVGESAGNRYTAWTTNIANSEVGALFLDNHYSVTSSNLTVSFDLNVLSGSTNSAQSATMDGTMVHPLFGVNTFSDVDPLRFNAVATSTTGGVYGIRNSSTATVMPFYTYTNGEDHNVTLNADYAAGTVDVLVDGVTHLSDFRFTAADASPNVRESFFYLNGDLGFTNSIQLDNIVGAVPEPASLMAVALGGAGLLARRGRRKNRN